MSAKAGFEQGTCSLKLNIGLFGPSQYRFTVLTQDQLTRGERTRFGLFWSQFPFSQ